MKRMFLLVFLLMLGGGIMTVKFASDLKQDDVYVIPAIQVDQIVYKSESKNGNLGNGLVDPGFIEWIEETR